MQKRDDKRQKWCTRGINLAPIEMPSTVTKVSRAGGNEYSHSDGFSVDCVLMRGAAVLRCSEMKEKKN